MALDTVLVAVGPSDKGRIDQLTDIVVDVAGPAGAHVVLAHVFERDQFDDTVANLDFESAGDADADQVAQRHETIRAIGDRLDTAGIEYDVRGAVGPHGDRIVDLASDVHADLLFVGGRRRSPTGKAVFGSTAQEVMLNASCPVTFVRSE